MSYCKRTSELFGALMTSNSMERLMRISSTCLHLFGMQGRLKWYGFTVHALTSLERVSLPQNSWWKSVHDLMVSNPVSPLDSFRNISHYSQTSRFRRGDGTRAHCSHRTESLQLWACVRIAVPRLLPIHPTNLTRDYRPLRLLYLGTPRGRPGP